MNLGSSVNIIRVKAPVWRNCGPRSILKGVKPGEFTQIIEIEDRDSTSAADPHCLSLIRHRNPIDGSWKAKVLSAIITDPAMNIDQPLCISADENTRIAGSSDGCSTFVVDQVTD